MLLVQVGKEFVLFAVKHVGILYNVTHLLLHLVDILYKG